MLAKTFSCGLEGVNGFLVEVEAFLSGGMVGFDIVGLPSMAVKESRDRIRAAIMNSGYEFPFGKATVNLAPADIRKEGTSFELAIAIALLAAKSPSMFPELQSSLLVGELSLEGKLLPIRGALAMAITAVENGISSLILPSDNARECECIEGLDIYPAASLLEVIEHLSGKRKITPQKNVSYEELLLEHTVQNDLKYVKGQTVARKALEIAAAGGHNLLLVGIPGSGKTMLARCLPDILPSLTYEEALETTMIHSAAGDLRPNSGLMTERPFCAPHHNTSMPAMIGGGAQALPGEVSLAHNGVLFLDELPEFQRATLEALRQPLEDGFVKITRVNGQNQYKSHCMLVAAMNPCPCGNLGSQKVACRCTEAEVRRYLGKISGPLLDRIDLQVEMDAVPLEEIETSASQEDTATVRARVLQARKRQQDRYSGMGFFCNAQLDHQGTERFCELEPSAVKLLHQAVDRFHISMRTYGRIKKVALTISDLMGHDRIQAQDVAQAIQFRNVEGHYWR